MSRPTVVQAADQAAGLAGGAAAWLRSYAAGGAWPEAAMADLME